MKKLFLTSAALMGLATPALDQPICYNQYYGGYSPNAPAPYAHDEQRYGI